MGISVYGAADAAHETARRFHKLGDWVAKLDLRNRIGFNYAHTSHPFHLTIWGDPVRLSEATVDIQPVSR